MENVKYWIFGIGLILISIGWYGKSEDITTFSKETLLTKEQKLKYIKKPHNNWYYRESTYKIVKKRSKIPFVHDEADTLRKPEINYYMTQEPLNHNGNPEDDNCGCD